MADDTLSEESANRDPYAQFKRWFEDAQAAGIPEPNAMAVATATREAAPSVRMVLLKEYDDRGFVFYTNYGSRKGHELDKNAQAALLFFWAPLARQVRIEGTVERVTRRAVPSMRTCRASGAQKKSSAACALCSSSCPFRLP